jgi:hypothetical protein
MTRARDLADSADKDIAGTLTLDDLSVSGSVGVGTSSPSSYNSNVNDLVVYNAASGGITIATGTSSQGAIAFADGTSGGDPLRGRIRYDHSNNSMGFRVNNDERMSIDSAGRVTKANQPFFYAYVSADQSYSESGTTVAYNATNYNEGSHFNTSNNRFTAPVAGIYLFNASIILEGIGAATAARVMLRFRINGSESRYAGATGGATNTVHDDNEFEVTAMIKLSAGDYVTVFSSAVNAGSGGNIWGSSSSGTNSWSRFQGYLLG